MEIDKSVEVRQNRIPKIQKIRGLFCRLISDGSVGEVVLFYRYFKKDLENPAWPVLKGPFQNIPIDIVSNIIIEVYYYYDSCLWADPILTIFEHSTTSQYSRSRTEKM